MFLVGLKDRHRIAQRADLERQIAKGGTPQEVADWNDNLVQVKRAQAIRISQQAKAIQALARQAHTRELSKWQRHRDELKKFILNPAASGKKPLRPRTCKARWRIQVRALEWRIESHRLLPAAKGLETATAKLARLVSLTPTDPDAVPRMCYISAVRSHTDMKHWRKEGRAHLPTALAVAKRILRSHGYVIPMDGESGGDGDGDDTIAEDSDEDVDEHGASAEERYLNDPPSNGPQDRKSGTPTTA